MSLESEFALRYFRRRSSRLVSRVSLAAAGSVALGVAALVVAMGLLSGYRGEIQSKLLGANAEVVLYPLSIEGIEHPEELAARLKPYRRVVASSPVIYWQGIAASEADREGSGIILKGIDPKGESAVTSLNGELGFDSALFAERDRVAGCAIGFDLARTLSVAEGDRIEISVPDASRRGKSFGVRRRAFRVAKIFRTNFYEYDSEWIFAGRDAVRALSAMAAPANVLEVKLDTIEKTSEATEKIRALAGERFSVTDWRSLNGALFSALEIQKVTLFLVIGLIVAVSTFNIVATLVMSVQERKHDIGALGALGAPPGFSSRVFLRLGFLLGGAGVAAGIGAGAAICFVVTRFHLISFPPEIAEIYFVSYVPFTVRAWDLAAITLFSLLVIAAACILPARRAARLDIAEALRYE